MVPKPQETILYGTRRDSQLEPCIVPQRPNFSTTSQDDLNFHIAKKHSAPKPVVTIQCKLFYQKFPGIYALRQEKTTQLGFLIKTAIVDLDDIISEVGDVNLEDELRWRQHFLLASELNVRDKILQLCYKEPQRKICGQRNWAFLQQL